MRKLLLIIIICCLITTICWLSTTQSGTSAIITTAKIITKGKLTVKTATGNLLQGLKLADVIYTNNFCAVNIKSLTITTTYNAVWFHGKGLNITPKLAIDLLTYADLTNNFITEITGHLDYRMNLIDTKLTVSTNNIAWLMRWCPDMTRLRGNFAAITKIAGPVSQPLITTAIDITNISMTFPAYGIKIKPLALHINSNNNKIVITGTGKMRQGPGSFNVTGFIDLAKPNHAHEIHITGKEVEFINTNCYQLIADPDLTISFKDLNTMHIAGNLQILRGNIDLDQRNIIEIHRSKDITLSNSATKHDNDELSIMPNIYLKIKDKVTLKGFGLNSYISGKLQVTKAEELLRGDGRISVKKGYYKLSGQNLYVHYGKLYYPPGTLLTNPNLDIKISKTKPIRLNKKQKALGYDNNKSCLYIQGTLSKPIFEDNGLIKNDQALAQLLNFSSGSLITKLQDKFNLTEFSITSDPTDLDPMTQQSKNDSLLDNKNLIIGKKLSKHIYLQYSKGLINSMDNTVRLKYLLTKSWSIGVDTGTLGNGADLSFSLDTD